MIFNLIVGILIPTLLSLGVYLGSFLFSPRNQPFILAIGMPLVFAITYIFVAGTPPWPPQGSNQSVFFALLLFPLLHRLSLLRTSIRFILVFGIHVLILWSILLPIYKYSWDFPYKFLLIILLAAIGSYFCNFNQNQGYRPKLKLITILAALSGLGLYSFLSGSALIAQLSGTLVLIMIPILSSPSKRDLAFEVLGSFFVLGFWLLGIVTYFFLDASLWQLAVLALPILSIGFFESASDSNKKRLALGVTIASLLLIPITLAYQLWQYLSDLSTYPY